MQTIRLYGNIAAVFHYGKDTIRTNNGIIDLPAILVPQAIAMGFSRNQPGPVLEPPADVPAVTAGAPPVASIGAGPASIAATVDVPAESDHAKKVALYEKEARDAGYDVDAVAKIVQERLRYDDLIADGASEDDAVAAVWGPKASDVSEVDAKAKRDALDESLKGSVDDRIKPFVPPVNRRAETDDQPLALSDAEEKGDLPDADRRKL